MKPAQFSPVLGQILAWLCIWSSVAMVPVGAAEEKNQKPNIVFIMVDDLGKDWVSCYGADNIQTPHIDQLAKEGMQFHNAWSMPQCTPTRVTLLTGQYPWRSGWGNHWDVPRWGVGYFDWKQNPGFAQALKKVGYKNAVAGKWQINDFRLEPHAMMKHGFDDWFLWTGHETGVQASSERYWDPYINSKYGSQTYASSFGPDLYNEFLVQFIKESKGNPWMVYYPMALTHGPLVATPDEPNASGPRGRFRAMVRTMDKLVGRIVKVIEDTGQTDNTLLIFTTDNGSPGVLGTLAGVQPSGGKGTLFEGGVCQPFIAKWPGRIKPGSQTRELIDFSDIYPTFLELGGASLPQGHHIDGHSFADLLSGKSKKTTRQWILSMGFGPALRDKQGIRGVFDFAPRVIRNKNYKAWVNTDRKVHALFHLPSDPFEKSNVLNQERSLSPAEKRALHLFQNLVSDMPELDGRPKYRDREPNSWDKPISAP